MGRHKFTHDQLKAIVWEAWETIPSDFIENLVNGWWDRCKAIIDAEGGPTRYYILLKLS